MSTHGRNPSDSPQTREEWVERWKTETNEELAVNLEVLAETPKLLGFVADAPMLLEAARRFRAADAAATSLEPDELAHDIAVAKRIGDFVAGLAANYPEDVFPADGTSRDAIAGAALRRLLPIIASDIRGGAWRDA
jgi:hypothetical protein